MSVTNEEVRAINDFVKKLSKRYPDCNVVDDFVNQEVRVIEEDLTYRYVYIIQMYQSMNW